MQNCCGIIAPSLCHTGGHSSHARSAEGKSSVMDEVGKVGVGSVSFSSAATVSKDKL